MPTVHAINDVVLQCQRLRGRGELSGAEQRCRRALVQIVSNGRLLFESGSNAYAAGDPIAARKRFRQSAVVLPDASAVHFNIGVCERALGRHEHACHALRKTLVIDPRSGGALDALAQSSNMLGKFDQAIALGIQQTLLLPYKPKPYATLGFIAWRSNRFKHALTALRMSLILDPAARDVDMNLANVLVRLKRFPEAEARYRRLARLAENDATPWLNLGIALVEAGNWRSAAAAYARYAWLTRGCPWNLRDVDPLPELPASSDIVPSRRTAWHALEFERRQLRYLLNQKLLPPDFEREANAYDRLIDNLDEKRRRAIAFDLTDAEMGEISRYHGRLAHTSPTGWPNGADRSATNPKLDWQKVEAAYHQSTPNLTIIDDFLTPSALSALRRFCLESTFWFELKGAGYLGAYFRDGFNDPLLLAIAEELTGRMPDIFAGQPLRMIWAYNYEQSMVGINPHADFARINVNFWITPDEANLDPETGGLLIYRRPAPESWGFEQYNGAPGAEIMEFLGDDAHNPIRVPHRQNRAVIFDSRLFHETDRLKFRDGFENRRINITMLFGGH